MKFEFDAQKSKVNKTKHGVDFVEAQTLWKDFDRLEIRARTEDEPRSLVVGKIGTKIGLPLSLIATRVCGLSPLGVHAKKKAGCMKAKELDQTFDEGKDISGFLDLSTAARLGQAQKRINLNAPVWMVQSLDKLATCRRISRQALIKIWLSEKIKQAEI